MKLTHIHQLELTSECNLRCQYCVSPNLQRPKVHMTEETFENALKWVEHFAQKNPGQQEINFAGIGESTLHPRFIEYLREARRRIGPGIVFTMATNGLIHSQEIASAFSEVNLKVWVSLHRPEKGKPALDLYHGFGVLGGFSLDPALASIDWAGQLKWPVSAPTKDDICPWLSMGRVMVMADGRITTCCLDGSGAGVVGDVKDEPHDIELKPYSLCSACHMKVPE